MIIKGEGEFRVDDKVFPVTEGSLVRVAPAGKRALRNTGKEHMVVMCIQYLAKCYSTTRCFPTLCNGKQDIR